MFIIFGIGTFKIADFALKTFFCNGFDLLIRKISHICISIVNHIEKMPVGFCGWAWRDIYKDLSVLYFGGNFNGHEEGVQHTSCSDGRKPVCFRLERLKE